MKPFSTTAVWLAFLAITRAQQTRLEECSCSLPAPDSSNDCALTCQEQKIDERVSWYYNACLHPNATKTVEDVWKPGDADRMYERILSEFASEYQPKVLSRDPWIVQLENIATLGESTELIRQTRMQVAEGDALAIPEEGNEEGGLCHSTQAWCEEEDCLGQPEVQSFIQKVEKLVDMPFRYAEPIHLIQYEPEQKYERHHDFNVDEEESMIGPRLFTLLVYLNDIDQGLGGETCFPEADVCVTPKLGRAVLFANVQSEEPAKMDNRTYHEANEIQFGFKNALTVWYHLRDYSRAAALGCMSTDIEDMTEIILGSMGHFGDDEENDEEEDEDWYDEFEEDYWHTITSLQRLLETDAAAVESSGAKEECN